MEMHGGVARDGWSALGLGYKKLLKKGTPATALVKSFYEMDEASTFGNAQHEFTLEVRVDGQAPYDLQGLFRIPVKLIGSVGPGTVVPVKVHPSDPKKAAIDWDSWDASAPTEQVDDAPGDVPAGDAVMGATTQETVHNAMPEANRNMMVNAWISATQSGAMSAAELDSALNDAVSAGMLTPEEADAARAQLG
ncbi:MAG: hypothetical protein WEA75_00080 [Acidimicrobiia bacterium]